MKQINVCGIPHKIIDTEDGFDLGQNLGVINYIKCEIRINKDLKNEAYNETLCHEVLHGILTHLGYDELSNDERFVTSVSNAINQCFAPRVNHSEG